MTSASVKNVGLDAGLLGAAVKNVNVQNTQKTQDFGTIMNQAAGKSKQDDTSQMTAKQQPTKDKTLKQTADTDTDKASVAEDMTEDTTQSVSQEAESVQETMPEDTPVSEEVEAVVDEATEGLLEDISDELDITAEELAAVLEQLGLQPIDLLEQDNLAQVVAAVEGADSLIEVAVDADMYQQLQNLTEIVDTTIEDILAETGLSEEELMDSLAQLKQQDVQEAVQLPVDSAEGENIVPFPAEEAQTVQVSMDKPMQTKEELPVTEEAPKPLTKEGEAATEQISEVPEAEQTAEEESTAADEELPDYSQGQENLEKFPNPLENKVQTTEAEVLPQRSIDTESIMKQLADYVKIQKGTELTEMELQLHPASLGSVRIALATKGGVVTAQITTQNEEVKHAIESQVVQLKDNLEEQGVKVEAVEVSVASHEMEKNLDQNGQEPREQTQENTTGGIRRIRRSNINMSLFPSEEDALEEAAGLDDATRIAMEMMAANGNTMDLLA